MGRHTITFVVEELWHWTSCMLRLFACRHCVSQITEHPKLTEDDNDCCNSCWQMRGQTGSCNGSCTALAVKTNTNQTRIGEMFWNHHHTVSMSKKTQMLMVLNTSSVSMLHRCDHVVANPHAACRTSDVPRASNQSHEMSHTSASRSGNVHAKKKKRVKSPSRWRCRPQM